MRYSIFTLAAQTLKGHRRLEARLARCRPQVRI